MSLTAETFAVKDGSLAPFAPFVTDYRPFVELACRSLERSVSFYSALFNVAPVERRAKSARFELTNPHLRLELYEDPDAVARDGHLGVQLKYNDDVRSIYERLSSRGVAIKLEETETACCFSVSNKIWVEDPDQNLWEVYVLVAENVTEVRCDSSCACEASGCG
jgi:catechol 2,3-dioxygenase-like lactoylglutathione lyase family enzyme